ncbi:conserved hypothetical protein [Theileria orientalis strain Shintoku]|uniref:Mucin-19-like n=1 Tax=Theileria orientalis strain Shintoku TaxID=869250 RepID=J4C3Z5_THEOR|nr:conserved hypothetical protein [Theileria orientalis strain Shintoku]BAM41296.1 conserved hypothetical protein [Theileria orientalis strain Shintoku]|eukprot:XP_009691597.1 conserved hypothetical protein [Theileria orientalis strain Shintoku]
MKLLYILLIVPVFFVTGVEEPEGTLSTGSSGRDGATDSTGLVATSESSQVVNSNVEQVQQESQVQEQHSENGHLQQEAGTNRLPGQETDGRSEDSLTENGHLKGPQASSSLPEGGGAGAESVSRPSTGQEEQLGGARSTEDNSAVPSSSGSDTSNSHGDGGQSTRDNQNGRQNVLSPPEEENRETTSLGTVSSDLGSQGQQHQLGASRSPADPVQGPGTSSLGTEEEVRRDGENSDSRDPVSGEATGLAPGSPSKPGEADSRGTVVSREEGQESPTDESENSLGRSGERGPAAPGVEHRDSGDGVTLGDGGLGSAGGLRVEPSPSGDLSSQVPQVQHTDPSGRADGLSDPAVGVPTLTQGNGKRTLEYKLIDGKQESSEEDDDDEEEDDDDEEEDDDDEDEDEVSSQGHGDQLPGQLGEPGQDGNLGQDGRQTSQVNPGSSGGPQVTVSGVPDSTAVGGVGAVSPTDQETVRLPTGEVPSVQRTGGGLVEQQQQESQVQETNGQLTGVRGPTVGQGSPDLQQVPRTEASQGLNPVVREPGSVSDVSTEGLKGPGQEQTDPNLRTEEEVQRVASSEAPGGDGVRDGTGNRPLEQGSEPAAVVSGPSTTQVSQATTVDTSSTTTLTTSAPTTTATTGSTETTNTSAGTTITPTSTSSTTPTVTSSPGTTTTSSLTATTTTNSPTTTTPGSTTITETPTTATVTSSAAREESTNVTTTVATSPATSVATSVGREEITRVTQSHLSQGQISSTQEITSQGGRRQEDQVLQTPSRVSGTQETLRQETRTQETNTGENQDQNRNTVSETTVTVSQPSPRPNVQHTTVAGGSGQINAARRENTVTQPSGQQTSLRGSTLSTGSIKGLTMVVTRTKEKEDKIARKIKEKMVAEEEVFDIKCFDYRKNDPFKLRFYMFKGIFRLWRLLQDLKFFMVVDHTLITDTFDKGVQNYLTKGLTLMNGIVVRDNGDLLAMYNGFNKYYKAMASRLNHMKEQEEGSEIMKTIVSMSVIGYSTALRLEQEFGSWDLVEVRENEENKEGRVASYTLLGFRIAMYLTKDIVEVIMDKFLRYTDLVGIDFGINATLARGALMEVQPEDTLVYGENEAIVTIDPNEEYKQLKAYLEYVVSEKGHSSGRGQENREELVRTSRKGRKSMFTAVPRELGPETLEDYLRIFELSAPQEREGPAQVAEVDTEEFINEFLATAGPSYGLDVNIGAGNSKLRYSTSSTDSNVGARFVGGRGVESEAARGRGGSADAVARGTSAIRGATADAATAVGATKVTNGVGNEEGVARSSGFTGANAVNGQTGQTNGDAVINGLADPMGPDADFEYFMKEFSTTDASMYGVDLLIGGVTIESVFGISDTLAVDGGATNTTSGKLGVATTTTTTTTTTSETVDVSNGVVGQRTDGGNAEAYSKSVSNGVVGQRTDGGNAESYSKSVSNGVEEECASAVRSTSVHSSSGGTGTSASTITTTTGNTIAATSTTTTISRGTGTTRNTSTGTTGTTRSTGGTRTNSVTTGIVTSSTATNSGITTRSTSTTNTTRTGTTATTVGGTKTRTGSTSTGTLIPIPSKSFRSRLWTTGAGPIRMIQSQLGKGATASTRTEKGGLGSEGVVIRSVQTSKIPTSGLRGPAGTDRVQLTEERSKKITVMAPTNSSLTKSTSTHTITKIPTRTITSQSLSTRSSSTVTGGQTRESSSQRSFSQGGSSSGQTRNNIGHTRSISWQDRSSSVQTGSRSVQTGSSNTQTGSSNTQTGSSNTQTGSRSAQISGKKEERRGNEKTKGEKEKQIDKIISTADAEKKEEIIEKSVLSGLRETGRKIVESIREKFRKLIGSGIVMENTVVPVMMMVVISSL